MAKRFIDGDALVEYLYKRYCIPCIKYEHSRSRCPICKINLYLDIVAEAPTADVVEVRHGEWIWTENGEADYEQYWVCSVCGEKSYIETKYCSDCGAKMDGGVTE